MLMLLGTILLLFESPTSAQPTTFQTVNATEGDNITLKGKGQVWRVTLNGYNYPVSTCDPREMHCINFDPRNYFASFAPFESHERLRFRYSMMQVNSVARNLTRVVCGNNIWLLNVKVNNIFQVNLSSNLGNGSIIVPPSINMAFNCSRNSDVIGSLMIFKDSLSEFRILNASSTSRDVMYTMSSSALCNTSFVIGCQIGGENKTRSQINVQVEKCPAVAVNLYALETYETEDSMDVNFKCWTNQKVRSIQMYQDGFELPMAKIFDSNELTFSMSIKSCALYPFQPFLLECWADDQKATLLVDDQLSLTATYNDDVHRNGITVPPDSTLTIICSTRCHSGKVLTLRVSNQTVMEGVDSCTYAMTNLRPYTSFWVECRASGQEIFTNTIFVAVSSETEFVKGGLEQNHAESAIGKPLIIGMPVASCVLLILMVLVVILCCRRRARRSAAPGAVVIIQDENKLNKEAEMICVTLSPAELKKQLECDLPPEYNTLPPSYSQALDIEKQIEKQ